MYLIYSEEALHRPMYIFLALLSFTDVLMCTSTLPNTLCILWFSLKEIDFKACLMQMFFVHTFTGMESGVLMLMALDRYVAICYPLRYATILTNVVIAKAGLLTFLRGVMLVIPFTFLTKRLPYCRGNVIPHTYCDHMSVAKISCGNVQISAIYCLMVPILIGALTSVYNNLLHYDSVKFDRKISAFALPTCVLLSSPMSRPASPSLHCDPALGVMAFLPTHPPLWLISIFYEPYCVWDENKVDMRKCY
jgi:hypothetical protein